MSVQSMQKDLAISMLYLSLLAIENVKPVSS